MQQTAPKPQPDNEVPGLKGLPLVGNLPQFQRDPLATLIKAAREGGDVVSIDLASQRYYLLSNPDHVRHVLQDNNKNYVKGYGKVRVLLGNGLVLSEGSFWRRQRRLMQPAFHRRRLAGFAEAMTGETTRMLDGWEARASGGRPLDVAMEMTLLTQRIIVKTMFGADIGAEGERIARAFETALAGIDTRFVTPLWMTRLPLPANRRFEKALQTIDDAVHRIIRERRQSGREGGDDLLSMLMQARDEETGETMSDRQIRDEVTTIYLAGHETTAVTLAWAWYLLSKSPEVTRRVREEVSRVLGERTPGIEDLPNLTYTKMVLDETLRLYPAAWMISRTAVEEDEIGGYRIPAGRTLFLSPYVTHRRTDLWPNPEGFDPERFAPPDGNGRPRFAYYPFGGGPRLCIGNNFALMEATLVVAMVMQRYRLDLVPGQTVKARPKGTLRPRPGVWMVPHNATGATI
ncbi:MAG: Cytochrome P450 [uncultured Rubrobacteraceae bacterium]|uniref:Cytochrome P450 n=1 Tax=uncultured Rubrobacteraceae bacterium TaxID=349277 RepID=A0A6J4QBT7_9ACTN|nr:MAG: Cytochrome P450 [uncultured Rubrobacteraceae bacterium]